MKKKVIRLTENDLHNIIKNSVDAYIREGVFNYITPETLEDDIDFENDEDEL